ncbi:MAG: hypothetical protein ACREOC_04520 [Gemmatimonadales bacterium]
MRKVSLALLVLTLSLLGSACTRNDPAGPSESPRPALSETQGADN